MDRDEMKLGVDMSDTLKAVFLPDELGYVKYITSNEAVAKVEENTGKVTGVSVGEAIIIIDAGNGVTNTCKVNVVPKPDHVTIDGAEFNVIVGKVIKLPVKMTMEDGSEDCLTTYTLSSSSTRYVAVNSAGQVKGVKAGSATVTLTAGNGDVVTCKVVVCAAPRKVVLNKSSIVLGEGMKTAELAARVYYSSSKYFTYSYEDCLGTGSFSSSNPAAATVDAATGEITAVAKGETVITFTTLNG